MMPSGVSELDCRSRRGPKRPSRGMRVDVAAWLRGLGLEQYVPLFRDNAIDAEVLPELSDADFEKLGIPLGHRKKLFRAIAALRATSAATEPSSSPGAPPLGSTGERRQVTVLFADLTGYTALSRELDAEEVHALLDRFFTAADGIVERLGGRVDKHIGDCVMAVFGAPVAHGNDPERAVRAALAIRDAAVELGRAVGRELAVHVGVAGGGGGASGIGRAARRGEAVPGETVNLASRLTDRAEPGEILISGAVHRALGERLDCLDAGALAVKGLADPVRAWRLHGLRAAGSDRRPFVGRRGELGQLLGALEACREGGCGAAVHLRGEAGIGKTRLVEEFRQEAAGRGFVCHTGLVLDFGGMGRDAVLAIVRSLLGLAETDGTDPHATRGAAERALADGLVDTERLVFLNDLLDLPQPAELRSLYDATDGAGRARGRRETVAALVRRASARRPLLLLVVEDLHWADADTLADLAVLAATVPDCPALLVTTSRPQGDPLDRGWRGAPLLTVDLGPLRRPEALTLAGTLGDPEDPFVLACVERAGGNPLFLGELMRGAEEAGMTGVPASVQSLVLARMDRLASADRSALQAASVLGQRFSPAALRHLTGDGRDLAPLVRHDFVRPDGEEFLFAHALVRDGVYSSLLKVRRRELHRRAAGWFADRDPVLRAEHLERAEDPAAARGYLAAARAQAAAYRTERALALAERGLTLARERADRFALACLRGELLHDLGSMEPCIEAYEGALATAEGGVERCQALLGLAAGLRIVDRHEEALRLLEQAEGLAVAHGLAPELARLHHLRGNLYFMLGDLAGCREQHERALEQARRAGSPELEARALSGLGDVAYAEGRMVTALACFRHCVGLAGAHGLGRVQVANQGMVPWARYYTNDPRSMLEDALEAVEGAVRVGHLRAEVIARDAACTALYDAGELERAAEHLARAHELARHLRARRLEAEVLLFRAQVELARGRHREALASLREGLAISRETGMDYVGPALLGALAAATDDADERSRALAEGEELLRRGSLSHNHLWFYRDAIEAALRAGDWNGAERFASALEDYTQGEALPWADFLVARARALAGLGRDGRDEGARRTLRRLRDEAERAGMRTAAAIGQRLGEG